MKKTKLPNLRKQIITKVAKPGKARPIRERDIETKVVAYAKQKGCLVYKFSSPSHRGVCDRVIIAPGGAVLFLELKRPKEKPTALQQKFLDDVAKQGGFSRWTDNITDGQKHVDEVVHEGWMTYRANEAAKHDAEKLAAELRQENLDSESLALLG